MTAEATCLHCTRMPLVILPESDATITFYRCPACQRHFARLPGRSLAERSGVSLGQVLYSTIFSQKPQADARRLAAMLRNQESREQLARIVTDIRQELVYPGLQVREIHGQCASEEDLRACLALLADLLTEEVKEDTILQTFKGHTSWVRCLAFSADGQTLASGSLDGTIKLWDLARGQLLHTLSGHGGGVFAVAWTPDGQLLVSCGEDCSIKVWTPQSGQLLRTLEGHARGVRSLAVSTDGDTLASASTDRTIRLWDLQSGQLLRSFSGHPDPLYSVAISPDHQFVASGDRVGVIRLWHVHSGELLRILRGHRGKVLSLALMNDGQFPVGSNMLFSASADRSIKWWRADDGRLISTFRGHTGPVRTVVCNQAWQTIVSSSEDKTIREWNLYGVQENIRILSGHSGPVYSLALSPDSRLLASGSLSIKIWGKKL